MGTSLFQDSVNTPFSSVDVFWKDNEAYQILGGGVLSFPYNGLQNRTVTIQMRPNDSETYNAQVRLLESDHPNTTLSNGQRRNFTSSNPFEFTVVLPYRETVSKTQAVVEIDINDEIQVITLEQVFKISETNSDYETVHDTDNKVIQIRDVRRDAAIWSVTYDLNDNIPFGDLPDFDVEVTPISVNDETGVGWDIKWVFTNNTDSEKTINMNSGTTPLGTGFIEDTGASYNSSEDTWFASNGATMGCSYGFLDAKAALVDFQENTQPETSNVPNLNPFSRFLYPGRKGVPGWFVDSIPALENTDYITRVTSFIQYNWIDEPELMMEMAPIRLRKSDNGGVGGFGERIKFYHQSNDNDLYGVSPGESVEFYQHVRAADLETTPNNREFRTFLPYKRTFQAKFGRELQYEPDFDSCWFMNAALGAARSNSGSDRALSEIATITKIADTPTSSIFSAELNDVLGTNEDIYHVYYGNIQAATDVIPWNGSVSAWITACFNYRENAGYNWSFWTRDGNTIYILTNSRAISSNSIRVVRGPNPRAFLQGQFDNGWGEFADKVKNIRDNYGYSRFHYRQIAGISWTQRNFTFAAFEDVFKGGTEGTNVGAETIDQLIGIQGIKTGAWWGQAALPNAGFSEQFTTEERIGDGASTTALSYEERELDAAVQLNLSEIGMDRVGGGSTSPNQIDPLSTGEIIRRIRRLRSKYPSFTNFIIEPLRSDATWLHGSSYISVDRSSFENDDWIPRLYNQLYWWLVGPHEKWQQINPNNTTDLSDSMTPEDLSVLASGCWDRYLVPHPGVDGMTNAIDRQPKRIGSEVVDIDTESKVVSVSSQHATGFDFAISLTPTIDEVVFENSYSGITSASFSDCPALPSDGSTYYYRLQSHNDFYDGDGVIGSFVLEATGSTGGTGATGGTDGTDDGSRDVNIKAVIDLNLQKKIARGKFWLSTGPSVNSLRE